MEAKSLGLSEESSSESLASRCVDGVLLWASGFAGLSSLQADRKANDDEIRIAFNKRRSAEVVNISRLVNQFLV